MPGKLVIISGPSGVGKSTICKQLVDRLDAFLSVSTTTREPRPGEVDGEAYHFVAKETFEGMIERDELLEYAQVYAGNYYGSPTKPVQDALDSGQTAILEIEIDGTIQVIKRRPDAVSIYILAPSAEDQDSRLRGRKQDTAEAISERLSKAEAEIKRAKECGAYKHFVVNEKLDETINEIASIVENAR